MDFSVPESVESLLPAVREFVERELFPLEGEFLADGFGALLPALEKHRQRVRKEGWWTPHLPRELGGLGLGLVEFACLSAELGRSPVAHYVFNCAAPDVGNMELLREFGDQRQKRQYLEPLARGEIRSCFAMTEPDYPGSNPVWMATRARKEGASYVLNGHKWFASSAEGAAFAVVMAVTDSEAPPHQRASLLIVPSDAAGFRLLRNLSVMGHRGEGWASHGEIVFEECRVPAANLVGEEGTGFRLAQARLGPGRIHHCMRWIGIAERAFELMCRRAVVRELAPGRPLGLQQTVQTWIAECRAGIDAARLMVLEAAWKIERQGAKAARREISTIKYFAADVMLQVLDRAIQVHGALGVTDDTPLAFFYRQERAARIYDGPDEVHKSSVARAILRSYGLRKEPSP